MNGSTVGNRWAFWFALLAATTLNANLALAHCDGMDGPVVKAAREALGEKNVNFVLIWVQPGDEDTIKTAFQKTLAVRKLGPEARELADLYFFETLVRIHRAGEGAPYTGLKPAGRDLGHRMGTLTKNRVRLQGSDGAEFNVLTQPTPLQQRALVLLEALL